MNFLSNPYVILAVFVLIFVVGYLFHEPKSAADQVTVTNLFLNASLGESATNERQPRFWRQGSFGDNDVVFRYPVEGYKDDTAVYVEMANHVTGDAKWMPHDVAVVPGARYTFSTKYRSNVTSKIFARYNRGTCLTDEIDCEFEELSVVAPATNWASAKTSFTVPSDVQTLTIFQLIDEDGWLSVDEISLQPEGTDLAVMAHKIPNPSLTPVTEASVVPAGWLESGYGENRREYEFVKTDGYGDSSSVKVTLSRYRDGDAKWMYEPQPITAGENYLLTMAYKTDIVPHIVVQFIDGAGAISYLGLPRPKPVPDEWQEYQQEFYVPEGTVLASAFMFAADNGYLQTDNYRVEPFAYQGFERPLVSLTFDDGAEENVRTALPLMERHGFKSTQCYMTANLVNNDADIRNVLEFKNAGHEICSHTVTHADLTTLPLPALERELTASKAFLEDIIKAPVPNFASPFGSYNPTVVEELKKHYAVHRTVDEGFNSPENLDLYRLRVQNMKPDTSLGQFKEWVDKAIADETWLILVYHRVGNRNLSAYDTYEDDFAQQMEYLAETGVAVLTMDEAVEEVSAQVVQ